MPAYWHFNLVRPGDRIRESQVRKFFKSGDNPAEPVVREGIQNSLDAADDDRIVRVRIAVGEIPAAQAAEVWDRYAGQLKNHLKTVADKFDELPDDGEPMRFLAFEDFETSGLEGDPGHWQLADGEKNGFFGFFRGEGVSGKEGNSRGRHGVGKTVFMDAGRVGTIFGLTRRADGRELLMGTSVLRHHKIDVQHYMPDGFYGERDPIQAHNVLPVEHDCAAIDRFKRDFALSRTEELGLSIVVPWLDPKVNRDSLIHAVIEGYFHPLLRNKLVVEIIDVDGTPTTIDHTTIRDVIRGQGELYAKKVEPRLDLSAQALAITEADFILLDPPAGEVTAPQWSEGCFPEGAAAAIRAKLDAGEMAAIRCRTRVRRKNEKQSTPGHFDVFLRREIGRTDYEAHFIRQGILVSDVHGVRRPGHRALVVIDDGDLATFLGDAETPSHTFWEKDNVKHAYTFHKATLEFVTNAISNILEHTAADRDAPDPLTMIDLFSEPSEWPDPKTGKKKKKGKKPENPEPKPPPPPPKPRWYRIDHVEGGFAVRPGSPEALRPDEFTVTMAYDDGTSKAIQHYHPADFRLHHRDGINIEAVGFGMSDPYDNVIHGAAPNEDFELVVSGFDMNRDVVVDVKPMYVRSPKEAEPAEVEPDDAVEVDDAQAV